MPGIPDAFSRMLFTFDEAFSGAPGETLFTCRFIVSAKDHAISMSANVTQGSVCVCFDSEEEERLVLDGVGVQSGRIDISDMDPGEHTIKLLAVGDGDGLDLAEAMLVFH